VRFVIALAVLLVPSVAAADESPVFVRVGLGVGRFRERQPRAGDSVLGSITQTGYGLELSVGASIRRFTVAATFLEHIVTFTNAAWAPTHPLESDATSLTQATLGPSIDYHFHARGGPYVGGLIGIASFANHTEDRPFGFGTAVHGGWDVEAGEGHRSAIGFGLRVYYATMGTERSGRAEVFSPMLMVHYAYR
jgi:hypothetical protein